MAGRKRYNDFTTYIKQRFGYRVQKVSINAGFTCPNIDGTKGRGGCTYCNNNTFNPDYCKPIKPIRVQINEGISLPSISYFLGYSKSVFLASVRFILAKLA